MAYRFFLSSSVEQLPVAKALEANLEAEGFEPTLWSRDAHGASQYNLEALLCEVESSDFAVFVFGPDDRATIRGETFAVVRDNVLLELGVFVGALGRECCYVVQSVEQPMHLPSDLDGLTTLHFNPKRSDGSRRQSLGPIATAIGERARSTAGAALSKFTANELKLLRSCEALSMPSNQAFKAFGASPTAWDDKLCMRFVHLLEQGLIRRTGATELELTRKGRLLVEAAQVLQGKSADSGLPPQV